MDNSKFTQNKELLEVFTDAYHKAILSLGKKGAKKLSFFGLKTRHNEETKGGENDGSSSN